MRCSVCVPATRNVGAFSSVHQRGPRTPGTMRFWTPKFPALALTSRDGELSNVICQQGCSSPWLWRRLHSWVAPTTARSIKNLEAICSFDRSWPWCLGSASWSRGRTWRCSLSVFWTRLFAIAISRRSSSETPLPDDVRGASLHTAIVRLQADGSEVTEFTSEGTGFVPPPNGKEPGWGIMSVELLPAGVVGSEQLTGVRLTAKVRVFGELAGGIGVESSELTFPITVCNGCLVSFPPEALDPATGRCVATSPKATSVHHRSGHSGGLPGVREHKPPLSALDPACPGLDQPSDRTVKREAASRVVPLHCRRLFFP